MSTYYKQDLPRHSFLASDPVWVSAKPGLEANQLCLFSQRKYRPGSEAGQGPQALLGYNWKKTC